MRKDEEDKKTNQEKTPFQVDPVKFFPFIEDIKTKNLNSPEFISVSFKNKILPQDSVICNPKNINFIPTKYPNSSLQFKGDTIKKFNEDTLFFMFFIQQDVNLRYLAFKELKRRGWLYHKRFLTFFQLQGTPKNQTDEILEGKFKFFDFEDGWIIRYKKDWQFELKYLENVD